MQTCALEQKLDTFADSVSAVVLQENNTPQQGTQQKLPSFEESILSTSSEGLLPTALGAAMAGTIGGFVNSVFPLGNLAVPVAGYLMMRFFKSGFLHGMGKGVLIAGIAVFLSGITGGLGGLLGGNRAAAGSGGAGAPVIW